MVRLPVPVNGPVKVQVLGELPALGSIEASPISVNVPVKVPL